MKVVMASPFAKLKVSTNAIAGSGGISPDGQTVQILIDIGADSSVTVATYLQCLELFNREFEKGLHAARAETVDETIEIRILAAPVSSTLIRQLIMGGAARIEILRSRDWIPFSETPQYIAEDFDQTILSEWLRTDRIFSLSHEGINYVPTYAFDSGTQLPLAGLEAVVTVLKTQNDGWEMAFWFASPNNFLGGRRPKDLLLSDPECVLAAAFEEVSKVMHG